MKKKIYRFVSMAVIVAAMAVGFQMSKAQSSSSALTMENVKALAMADDEGGTGRVICRCHIDSGNRCYLGHRISFRMRCFGCEGGNVPYCN